MIHEVWNRLIACTAVEEAQARKGRLLAIVLIGFILLDSLTIVHAVQAGTTPPAIVFVLIGILGLFSLLYILNRQGHVFLAIWGVLGITALAITAICLVPPPTDASEVLSVINPFFLALIIGGAGVFLPLRTVPWVVAALILEAAVLFNVSPGLARLRHDAPDQILSLILNAAILFIATGIFAWATNWLLAQALATLQFRNRQLATTQRQQQTVSHLVQGGLGQHAAELDAMSTRQVEIVDEQAQGIHEIGATIRELETAAQHIEELAAAVSAAASQVQATSAHTQDLLARNQRTAMSNEAQSVAASTQMARLDAGTANMISWIGEVQEIAANTNLVSINAQIEAAGAGPYGLRFGVIANEIGELARHTRQLVTQIQEGLPELQQAQHIMIARVQAGRDLAQDLGELTLCVQQAQADVIRTMASTLERIAEIHAATHQQTAATTQVTVQMQHLLAQAQATGADARQVQQVAQALTASAARLRTVVSIPVDAPAPALFESEDDGHLLLAEASGDGGSYPSQELV